jgi:DNA-binding winged helix-turn-helix (wHTH) protein
LRTCDETAVYRVEALSLRNKLAEGRRLFPTLKRYGFCLGAQSCQEKQKLREGETGARYQVQEYGEYKYRRKMQDL